MANTNDVETLKKIGFCANGDFKGADLTVTNLYGNSSNSDFQQANLQNSKFTKANLQKSNFSKADIK